MLYLAFGLEILVMLGLPVALWLFLRRRAGVTWSLILTGALTFVLSQVVHVPLNLALGLAGEGRGVALWPLPLQALAVGLSAGLCEEVLRYLVLRFWRREARSWAQGVAFGAGHGGVEAILLGLLVLSTFVSMLVLRQVGPASTGLSGDLLEQTQAQVDAYWSISWYLPLLGALERVAAITMHVAWSLAVLRAVTDRNLGWLAVAVAGHALVDGVVVWLVNTGWSLPAVEGVVLLFALAASAFIVAQRSRAAEADVSRETPT